MTVRTDKLFNIHEKIVEYEREEIMRGKFSKEKYKRRTESPSLC